jgi:hypothetical protein
MQPRIPLLALVGLQFTRCTGGDEAPANPIVGDWGAVQRDGDKLPDVYVHGPSTDVSGLRLEIDDDLGGSFEYYSELTYDTYEYRHSFGSELLVDDSAAPKYRIEVQKDILGGDEAYTDSVGTAVTSDGYDDEGYGGDGLAPGLAAPSGPIVAPAELVFTCTLDQDTLTCTGEGSAPKSLIFKRKLPAAAGEG